MKHLFLPIFLASALAFCPSCSKSASDEEVNTTKGPTTYEVKVGECFTAIGGFTQYCLLGIEDSRCPCNVECIWEGICQVTLGAGPANGPATDTLLLFTLMSDGTTPAGFPNQVEYKGQKLVLVKSEPDILCGNEGKYNLYNTSIRVE